MSDEKAIAEENERLRLKIAFLEEQSRRPVATIGMTVQSALTLVWLRARTLQALEPSTVGKSALGRIVDYITDLCGQIPAPDPHALVAAIEGEHVAAAAAADRQAPR
jgi:hypothetical protein